MMTSRTMVRYLFARKLLVTNRAIVLAYLQIAELVVASKAAKVVVDNNLFVLQTRMHECRDYKLY
jgi:hypothetical protein